MLTEVLRSVQRFEHTHGSPPNVVYLNARHWLALLRDCPGLRGCDGAAVTPLGFHILILPVEDLPHPRAARLGLARAEPPASTARSEPVAGPRWREASVA